MTDGLISSGLCYGRETTGQCSRPCMPVLSQRCLLLCPSLRKGQLHGLRPHLVPPDSSRLMPLTTEEPLCEAWGMKCHRSPSPYQHTSSHDPGL